MSDPKEIAKAVQSVAKTGKVAIDATRSLGEFMARVFKEPTEEIVGMLTDRLRFVRWQRMLRLSDEAQRILVARGVVDTRPVPPKLALPIFEESSLEEDDDLHQLWCNLLANAMDPDFEGELRIAFVDMIRALTAVDVCVLRHLHQRVQLNGPATGEEELRGCSIDGQKIAVELGLEYDIYLISACNLMRVRCVDSSSMPALASIHSLYLSPLGLRFMEVCTQSPRHGKNGTDCED
jgi:hypothetical protein